jgi:hypothetical protein
MDGFEVVDGLLAFWMYDYRYEVCFKAVVTATSYSLCLLQGRKMQCKILARPICPFPFCPRR